MLIGWNHQVLPKIVLKPGPTLTFPKVTWVPRDTQAFNVSGMQGSFEQLWKLVGTLCVLGVDVELRVLVLWDSHPEGQVGHIVQSAPRRQHFFLRNYFLNIDPIKCMIAETASMPPLVCNRPAILFTRYIGNTYVAFCNVPQSLLCVARECLVHLQRALHQVPFKREPEGQFLH